MSHVSVGIKNCGGIGPWFYFERGNVLIHFWLRYFSLPWQHGLGWGLNIWLGERRFYRKGGA